MIGHVRLIPTFRLTFYLLWTLWASCLRSINTCPPPLYFQLFLFTNHCQLCTASPQAPSTLSKFVLHALLAFSHSFSRFVHLTNAVFQDSHCNIAIIELSNNSIVPQQFK